MTIKINDYTAPDGLERVRQILNEGGECWTTDEVTKDFDIIGFAAPFVVAVRKSDGVKGSLEFTHNPRVYFDFRPA